MRLRVERAKEEMTMAVVVGGLTEIDRHDVIILITEVAREDPVMIFRVEMMPDEVIIRSHASSRENAARRDQAVVDTETLPANATPDK